VCTGCQNTVLPVKCVCVYVRERVKRAVLRTRPNLFARRPIQPRLVPAYSADDINLVSDIGRRLHLSAADRLCVVPRTHNTFGAKSLTVTSPQVLNNLPSHLRQDINYRKLKRQLKTSMFEMN